MTEFPRPEAGNAPLKNPSRKPKAAWLLQFVAAAGIVTLLVGITRLGTLVATDSSNVIMERAIDAAVWRAFAVGILALVIAGTQRRTSYGRILGLLCIAFVFGTVLFRQLSGSVAPSEWRLSYSDQQVGESAEAVGDLFVLFVIGYWFYAFGLSRRARDYFGPR